MRRVVPLILLAVGIALMAVAIVLGVRGVADAVSSTTEWTSDAPRQVFLTQGDWALYEEVVSPSPLARDVAADGVTVEAPSGPVPVTAAGIETLTVSNRTYAAVARFTAPVDATYSITVEPAGARLMIGRPVGATILRTFGFFGLLTLGGLLAFGAVIWLIVAFIVSRSGRQPAGMPGSAAAGTPATLGGPGQWYPDPEDPTQWRLWDGRAWTDLRAPRQ